LPSFSTTLEASIHQALAYANARRHELATIEHLLLALIDEPDARLVLQACAVDLEQLFNDLTHFVDEDLANFVSDVDGSEAVPTAAFQRVIQRAAIHVQSSGRSEVTGANVLVALFPERESNAVAFLEEQDMTRYEAVNFIAHGVAKDVNFAPTYTFTQVDEPEEEERLTEAEWRAKSSQETKLSGDSAQVATKKNETEQNAGVSPKLSSNPFLFLSYSSVDRALVESFILLLKQHKISVWWDQDIRAGADWRTEIANKIDDANVVLTLWTENSTISKAVVEEASTAQGQRKLVHARIDNSTIPYGFGETQYVDLREWDGTDRHPVFQKLVFAIYDRMVVPTTDFVSSRLRDSSPVEVVASSGRLTIKDSPSNVAPPIVNPIELDVRLQGLQHSVASMCAMCADETAFQLPRTLHHCLYALTLAATTQPVTWYALEDAKSLLSDCMVDSHAEEAWNAVVFRGVTNLIARIDEIRPLIEPRQIDPDTDEPKPPSPEPIISDETFSEISRIAGEVMAEVESEEGEKVLDVNTKQNLSSLSVQIDEIGNSIEPNEKKIFKLRRALKGLAYITGGIVTAIGTGVIVNLLTAPSAALTLLSRMKPIFDSILQFFI